MRQACLTLATAFVVGHFATAWAQSIPQADQIQTSIVPEVTAIGQADWLDAVTTTRTLTGRLDGDFNDFFMQLSYGSSTQGCFNQSTTDCPQTVMGEGVGGISCRCIEESEDITALADEGNLVELTGIAAETLCSFDADEVRVRSLYFVTGWETTGDDLEETDDSQLGDPLEIRIDFEPPPAPPTAPTLIASEGALKVTIAKIEEATDVDDYEVCVRRCVVAVDEEAGDGGIGANEPLCRDGASPAEDFKFDGLENGVTYCVSYRAVDTAGNVGPSSEETRGRPIPLLDFAELYRNRGGLETGGCRATNGLGTSTLLLLFGLLATGRRRR